MTTLFPDVSFVTATAVQSSFPETGVERRVGAYNDKLFLATHRMEKGWAGAPHSHAHDQVVYVVSGHLRIDAGGQTFEIRAGDSFIVRGGVLHQASALEPSFVIDVFTPCREDYL